PALVGKRPGAARHLYAGCFQMRGDRIEGGGVGDLPTVEGWSLIFVGVHDDALLAIVHTQRQGAPALIDQLHAEKTRAVAPPVFQLGGADTDITKRIKIHGFPLGPRRRGSSGNNEALYEIIARIHLLQRRSFEPTVWAAPRSAVAHSPFAR